MSLFAPLAAAPRLVLAAVLEVAPVPPWAMVSAVVRPERLVMSLFAPLAAAPRFVRAAEAVVAPVPPYPMALVATADVTRPLASTVTWA